MNKYSAALVPSATLHRDGRVTISAPYTPLLRQRLRADIVGGALSWDTKRRRWVIAPGSSDVALRAFRRVFPDAKIYTIAGVA